MANTLGWRSWKFRAIYEFRQQQVYQLLNAYNWTSIWGWEQRQTRDLVDLAVEPTRLLVYGQGGDDTDADP